MRNHKYQNITIETAVPIEIEPVHIDNLPGVKINVYGELDVLHQISRYTRHATKKASTLALGGLQATLHGYIEFSNEWDKQFNQKVVQ